MNCRLLFTCLSVGLILSTNQHLAAQTTNSPTLTGSWQLTLVSTGPAASAAVVPVQGLATFTSDGTVIETDTAAGTPRAAVVNTASFETPGHGIWQPGPALGNFYIEFINLLVSPTSALSSKKTVTITGSLDSTGNQFTGNYTYQQVDPSGAAAGRGSGTVTGKRILHPLLP